MAYGGCHGVAAISRRGRWCLRLPGRRDGPRVRPIYGPDPARMPPADLGTRQTVRHEADARGTSGESQAPLHLRDRQRKTWATRNLRETLDVRGLQRLRPL